MKIKKLNKKAQLTIFIIIGIIILAIIALFLFLRTDVIPEINFGQDESPESFLKSCMEEKITDTIEVISMQGGYIENELNKEFKFEDENDFWKISYLCYNHNYYLPCINQEPVLISHLKEEVHDEVSDEVRSCFDALAESFEKEGYTVNAKYNGFEVDLMPKKAIIKIDGEMTLTKTDESKKEKDFDIVFKTRFYDLAVVAQEIISQEARFCNFETLGFMLFYPEFNIDRFRTSDSTIIYTIQHRDTLEKFRFAVRGCVIPPGF